VAKKTQASSSSAASGCDSSSLTKGLHSTSSSTYPSGTSPKISSMDYRALLVEPVKDWLHYGRTSRASSLSRNRRESVDHQTYCSEIFQRAIANHDCDIRAEDVESAIIAVIPALGASSFQHYWEDAISGGESEPAVRFANSSEGATRSGKLPSKRRKGD